MAVRVAVNRIISGSGDNQKVVEPGQRFDSTQYGISDDDLKRMEETGIVRKPRDDTVRAPAEAGPIRGASEPARPLVVEDRSTPVIGEPARPPVVENRSGPVAGDATSDMPNKMDPKVSDTKSAEGPSLDKTGSNESNDSDDSNGRRRRRTADDEL